MPKRIQGLMDELATLLNELPGVFSTPQWGGRAYKVGTTSRFKVLAHVGLTRTVSFKLTPPRASDVLDRHEWVQPHAFRTLAPAGWLTATITTRRQVTTLGSLLTESHGLYR